MKAKVLEVLKTHLLLSIIVALFLALAVTYSIVTPIFEAGDEIWHYPYVQHLATGQSLPVQDPTIKTLWAQEGGQPPLYYALAALATFWIDTRDLPERLWLNPHAAIGIPLLFGNKNMVVHTSAESFPWHNTALAVHLIRFLSILFSAATVALTYFLALEIASIFPARRGANSLAKDGAAGPSLGAKQFAAGAAALVAFNPMFIFISASVNNDSLAAMLAALALLLLARFVNLAKDTTAESPQAYHHQKMRMGLGLGVVLGLAAITKVSDLGLVVIAAGVYLSILWKEPNLSRAFSTRGGPTGFLRINSSLTPMLVSAALVILIAFWWYVRNWLYYGDPFAFNVWVAIAGGRPVPATLSTLLGEFQGLRISFWGNFGGVNIIAPEWVYTTLDILTVAALVGLLLGLARRVLPRLLALPASWFLLISAALVRWTFLTLASQGRLLFPAISAVGVLLAFGLAQLSNFQLPFVKRVHANWLLALGATFLFVFSALAPFSLIAPTYALPRRLPADATVPNPIHIVFEDQAELVGYDLPQRSIANAELPVTLYWRAQHPMNEDYSVYIHLFDAGGEAIGQWDAFPGNGLYPTRLWQPNEIMADNYRIPVSTQVRGPSVGRVEVGLYRLATLSNLPARDAQGRTITPTIARFKIPGQTDVRIENPMDARFGEQIALVGYGHAERVAPGSSLQVRLYWRALVPLTEDYTFFVHLVDASGKTIAQKDDQPQQGRYPTSFWDVSETIADSYIVEIPRDAAPGEYRIEVGIYRAGDGSRLPVTGGDYANLGIVQFVK